MNITEFFDSIGGRQAVMAETGLSKGRISQMCRAGSLPRSWAKYFMQKYPQQCGQFGIVDMVVDSGERAA